jgi:hypothetical protein
MVKEMGQRVFMKGFPLINTPIHRLSLPTSVLELH